MVFARHARPVAADKAPQCSAFSAFDAVTSDSSMANGTGLSALGGAPP